MAGLEPADEGVKVPCLTTWLHPCVGERLGPEQKLRPFRLNVGWVKGFEPSTPGTTIRCSNQLSYTHHITDVRLRLKLAGTPGGTRTPGPLLRRQLLYPPELQAHMERVMGIEPTRPAWKAGILPLNYTRMVLPLTSANGYYHIFAGLSMGFLKFSGPPPWKFGIPQPFVVQMPSPCQRGEGLRAQSANGFPVSRR